jgi:hypothetical protein
MLPNFRPCQPIRSHDEHTVASTALVYRVVDECKQSVVSKPNDSTPTASGIQSSDKYTVETVWRERTEAFDTPSGRVV